MRDWIWIRLELLWLHCKLDLTQQFRLSIYLDLDLFGTWNPLWNKDKVYKRSSSVRLSFVTVFDFGPQHTVSHSIVKVIKEKPRALYHEHINNTYDHFVSQVPNNIYHFSLIIGCSKHYQWTFQLYKNEPVRKEGH